MHIGRFEILQADEEHFEVRRYMYDNSSYNSVKICGGDFETLLDVLFMITEKHPLRKTDEQLSKSA